LWYQPIEIAPKKLPGYLPESFLIVYLILN